jgi:hypothetical protein
LEDANEVTAARSERGDVAVSLIAVYKALEGGMEWRWREMDARNPGDPATHSTLEAVRRFNEAFDRHDVGGVPRLPLHHRGDLRFRRPALLLPLQQIKT